MPLWQRAEVQEVLRKAPADLMPRPPYAVATKVLAFRRDQPHGLATVTDRLGHISASSSPPR